ncbi:hypothetical protein ACEQ6C_38815, partial [Rhizobium ruizarguesonis]
EVKKVWFVVACLYLILFVSTPIFAANMSIEEYVDSQRAEVSYKYLNLATGESFSHDADKAANKVLPKNSVSLPLRTPLTCHATILFS